MSRSVEVPRDAVAVAYRTLECEEASDYAFEYEDLVACVQERCCALWPSLEVAGAGTWLHGYRETRVLCESRFAYVTLSEYCGAVAVAVVNRPYYDNSYYAQEIALAQGWCNRIAAKFEREFGEMTRAGTFSNGEVLFERIKQ